MRNWRSISSSTSVAAAISLWLFEELCYPAAAGEVGELERNAGRGPQRCGKSVAKHVTAQAAGSIGDGAIDEGAKVRGRFAIEPEANVKADCSSDQRA